MDRRPGLARDWRVVSFDEIDSTNSEAMRRAAAGERGPVWIVARHQTKGRGRSGRVWSSAHSGLAATLLFSPRCPVGSLSELALVSGVAAYDAISAQLTDPARAALRLKWPNDVLVGGAKVSGILVESSIMGASPVAVIGTGINIAVPPEISRSDITALADHGATTTFEELFCALSGSLAHWIDVWADGAGFAAIRQAWLDRAGPIGEPMSVNAVGTLVGGDFAGLDGDGGLLLRDEAGITRKFTFGDVALGVMRV